MLKTKVFQLIAQIHELQTRGTSTVAYDILKGKQVRQPILVIIKWCISSAKISASLRTNHQDIIDILFYALNRDELSPKM